MTSPSTRITVYTLRDKLAGIALAVMTLLLAPPAMAQGDARDRWLAMTPEERTAAVERAKARRDNLTPDQRENIRERRAERRDIREDRRDAAHQGGFRDQREDRRERRGEVRDRREDRIDRRR